MSHLQSNALCQKWQHVLSRLVIKAERLAQSSQRKRKMSVEQLVQTLVLGCLEPGQVSLRLWSEVAAEMGCEISASSLDERLTPRVVVLLYEILQSSMQQQVDVSRLPVERLQQFKRLIVYDSTPISLPPILQHAFRASRETGLGHMKLQVGYDYLNAQLQALMVHEGIQPDQKDVGLLAEAVENTLLIFDLGYFDQQVLAQIQGRGAYFVTRYQSQTGVYDGETPLAIDLSQQLKQHASASFEADYYLGAKARVKVRLVARRVSPHEAQKRRQGVRRRAQQAGYTPSQRSLILCDWEIVITNLPPEWTSQQLFDVYRIRWQIELLFKAWKSRLDLTHFGPWRAVRVLCQLYATLIGAVLCQSAFATVRALLPEMSLLKAFPIVRRHIPHLYRVIRHNWRGLLTWTRQLQQALLHFGRQQNLETAPSSLRRLMDWG